MSSPPLLSGSPLADWLRQASALLHHRLEAELLLAHVLGVGRSWIYAHGEARLNSEQQAALADLLARRAGGEPMAYLLGSREFYGRCFGVSPAVLIPRPETELLVDCTLSRLDPGPATLADIGTGSGCIALTLAAERPSWQLVAVDVSDAALAVARSNAARLAVTGVEWVRGDLLAPLAGRCFDAIVSNPPYVADADPHLAQGDLRFEPALALGAGSDGLSLIVRLIEQAPVHLKPHGWLLIEHGHDQAPMVRDLLSASGFASVASHRDLAGIERVSVGQWP